MSFQSSINDYLKVKLNANTYDVEFNLFYRFQLEEEDFSKLVFESIDWETDGTGTAENNVVVEFEGQQYNTQLGEYTVEQMHYVPCIIEDYIAEFEPVSFVKNGYYDIPITFYINETINSNSNDAIYKSLAQFQDSLRGVIAPNIDNVRVLFNHGDVRPMSGIMSINGSIFREYQLVVSLEFISDGYFGNEIEYFITVDAVDPDTELPLVNNGEELQVYPVSRNAELVNSLNSYQRFKTNNNTEYNITAIPDVSALSMDLTFLYQNNSFVKWLITQKYAQTEPQKIFVRVKYPLIHSLGEGFGRFYIPEIITGVEEIGEKLAVTVKLKPVSEVYSI